MDLLMAAYGQLLYRVSERCGGMMAEGEYLPM